MKIENVQYMVTSIAGKITVVGKILKYRFDMNRELKCIFLILPIVKLIEQFLTKQLNRGVTTSIKVHHFIFQVIFMAHWTTC